MSDQADPAIAADRTESGGQDVSQEQRQTLEVRWKSLLGLEASIEALRASIESLRMEMEAANRKSMNVEEKVNALQADVAQWNKAKNRIHYTLPKVREFVHRATWAQGVPERKKLEEIFKAHAEPQIPSPELDQVPETLDSLLKDRQVLAAHGNTVAQECRSIIAEINRVFGTLQRNSADRARQKRDARREKR
jgi:uncharacterized protein YoxC